MPTDHVPDRGAPEVVEQFVWNPTHSALVGLDVEEARGDARFGPRLAEINDPPPLAMAHKKLKGPFGRGAGFCERGGGGNPAVRM